jgi:hypothetical protein
MKKLNRRLALIEMEHLQIERITNLNDGGFKKTDFFSSLIKV